MGTCIALATAGTRRAHVTRGGPGFPCSSICGPAVGFVYFLLSDVDLFIFHCNMIGRSLDLSLAFIRSQIISGLTSIPLFSILNLFSLFIHVVSSSSSPFFSSVFYFPALTPIAFVISFFPFITFIYVTLMSYKPATYKDLYIINKEAKIQVPICLVTFFSFFFSFFYLLIDLFITVVHYPN